MIRMTFRVENIAVRSSRGIDYCQDKVRTVHAKEMFGDESIELQTLTVNVCMLPCFHVALLYVCFSMKVLKTGYCQIHSKWITFCTRFLKC